MSAGASEKTPLLETTATVSEKEVEKSIAGVGEEVEKRYLLVYGASLHPKLLRPLLAAAKPLSQTAVIVPNAWMTYDFRGVAYIEPCYTSAVIRGVSDANCGAENEEDFKRWVWDRCSPQLEYRGEYPPSLEGVAFEFSARDWPRVLLRTNTSSPDLGLLTPSQDLVQVSCTSFENGDPQSPTGSFKVWVPIARREYRLSGLQPTLTYHRLVLIGSFFSMLSQPFLAHLFAIQPYKPNRIKRIVKALLTFSLLPCFVSTMALKSIGLGRVGNFIEAGVWRATALLEGLLKNVVGSGYRNEGEKI